MRYSVTNGIYCELIIIMQILIETGFCYNRSFMSLLVLVAWGLSISHPLRLRYHQWSTIKKHSWSSIHFEFSRKEDRSRSNEQPVCNLWSVSWICTCPSHQSCTICYVSTAIDLQHITKTQHRNLYTLFILIEFTASTVRYDHIIVTWLDSEVNEIR